MIPLVFEHFGHWGSEGEKFRHYIAKLSRNDQREKNEADFCRYWRKCFSVSLQKCNSSVILKKPSCLSQLRQDRDQDIADRDIHSSSH